MPVVQIVDLTGHWLLGDAKGKKRIILVCCTDLAPLPCICSCLTGTKAVSGAMLMFHDVKAVEYLEMSLTTSNKGFMWSGSKAQTTLPLSKPSFLFRTVRATIAAASSPAPPRSHWSTIFFAVAAASPVVVACHGLLPPRRHTPRVISTVFFLAIAAPTRCAVPV
ncbi:hypothetical protein GUJ93_ZPchr0012g20383 [Zizania palustris]|uniref:Uncharacterized protein n=1 Tax=Zizania palustris TaxID=103762 RepID=A0A8J6BVH0_ZIZPA|nr:hypothetical protein GUJ93_ZPchr0012g20383 [Zizania palustris]